MNHHERVLLITGHPDLTQWQLRLHSQGPILALTETLDERVYLHLNAGGVDDCLAQQLRAFDESYVMSNTVKNSSQRSFSYQVNIAENEYSLEAKS